MGSLPQPTFSKPKEQARETPDQYSALLEDLKKQERRVARYRTTLLILALLVFFTGAGFLPVSLFALGTEFKESLVEELSGIGIGSAAAYIAYLLLNEAFRQKVRLRELEDKRARVRMYLAMDGDTAAVRELIGLLNTDVTEFPSEPEDPQLLLFDRFKKIVSRNRKLSDSDSPAPEKAG